MPSQSNQIHVSPMKKAKALLTPLKHEFKQAVTTKDFSHARAILDDPAKSRIILRDEKTYSQCWSSFDYEDQDDYLLSFRHLDLVQHILGQVSSADTGNHTEALLRRLVHYIPKWNLEPPVDSFDSSWESARKEVLGFSPLELLRSLLLHNCVRDQNLRRYPARELVWNSLFLLAKKRDEINVGKLWRNCNLDHEDVGLTRVIRSIISDKDEQTLRTVLQATEWKASGWEKADESFAMASRKFIPKMVEVFEESKYPETGSYGWPPSTVISK